MREFPIERVAVNYVAQGESCRERSSFSIGARIAEERLQVFPAE
jgi:hypothetical protein